MLAGGGGGGCGRSDISPGTKTKTKTNDGSPQCLCLLRKTSASARQGSAAKPAAWVRIQLQLPRKTQRTLAHWRAKRGTRKKLKQRQDENRN